MAGNVNEMNGIESVFVEWWNVDLNYYWLPLNTYETH